MKNATGYMKISKFLRGFGGNSNQATPAQSVIEPTDVAQPSVQKQVQTKRPRLKSASAANGLGDFQSVSHPAGIKLHLQPAHAAHQPTQLGKDAPLSAVFSRLMTQPATTNTSEQNLRSMLGLAK